MISIRNLVKEFDLGGKKSPVLRNVSLEMGARSFFTLLGPSGCGKSTLLRCIAGLETPTSGEILINGEIVFSKKAGISVPASKRKLGMVFQSYAIWPHMTVFQNVAFPLEVQHRPEIRSLVEEALSVVGLTDFADRYPSKLSGGQQQRVALARAIVGRPEVLLLDEPLSNLDAALRTQMRTELRGLQQSLGLTAIYVTHDQMEALSMSDQIAVVKEGRIVEQAAPEALYNRPRNVFAAEFLGSANVLRGQVTSGNDTVSIETAIGPLEMNAGTPGKGDVTVFIRPDRIQLAGNGADRIRFNCLQGTVQSSLFTGEMRELEVLPASSKDGTLLRCRIPADTNPAVGSVVDIFISPSDIALLDER